MEILVLWLGLSIVAAVIASNKGRSGFGFFLLSVVLSPLIGIIAALVVQTRKRNVEFAQLSSGEYKKCPYCAELVRSEAIKCKHCGSDLHAAPAPAPSGAAYAVGSMLGHSVARTSAMMRGQAAAPSLDDTPMERGPKIVFAVFILAVAAVIVGGIAFEKSPGSIVDDTPPTKAPPAVTPIQPAPGQSDVSSVIGWRRVRTVGMIEMVYVDPARDKDKGVYRAAVASVCAGKDRFCKALFWSDAALVPKAMPMSVDSARAMRADWTQNAKTGHRQMLWACDIDPDPSQCFKP